MAGFADAARGLGKADVGGAEHRSFVAVAEGSEAFDLADGLMRECRERSFGVDEEFGDALFLRDGTLGVVAEGEAERLDGRFIDRKAGGSLVSAVAEEMAATGGEPGVQIEAAGGAARAGAGLGAELVE